VLTYVSLRPSAGEGDGFLVHANVLFLKEARPIPDTPKTLASTLASPPDLHQIVEELFQWIETRQRNGFTRDDASD
jgi:hypothetical protein